MRARARRFEDAQAVAVGPAGPAGAGTTSCRSADRWTTSRAARPHGRRDAVGRELLQSPTGVGGRASQAGIDAAVSAFSLQRGPAEDTAFIDFDTLQIAFDHVWQQLLDERIPDLAYTANTIAQRPLRDPVRVDDVLGNGLNDR